MSLNFFGEKLVQVEKFESPCQLPDFLMPSFENVTLLYTYRHKLDNLTGMPFYLFLKLFTANA